MPHDFRGHAHLCQELKRRPTRLGGAIQPGGTPAAERREATALRRGEESEALDAFVKGEGGAVAAEPLSGVLGDEPGGAAEVGAVDG